MKACTHILHTDVWTHAETSVAYASSQEEEKETTAVKTEPAMALTSQKVSNRLNMQLKVGVATYSFSPAYVDTQRNSNAMRSRTPGRGEPWNQVKSIILDQSD